MLALRPIQAQSSELIPPPYSAAPCQPPLMNGVGDVEAELEEHIHDCGLLLERAYARFQAHHNPADREEALFWWAEQQSAICSRSPEVQARRHADLERRLDEGVDYFSVQGLRDRALMEGTT